MCCFWYCVKVNPINKSFYSVNTGKKVKYKIFIRNNRIDQGYLEGQVDALLRSSDVSTSSSKAHPLPILSKSEGRVFTK